MDQKLRSAITLPCHWDKKVIEEIVRGNGDQENTPVVEVYGALPAGGPIGHGRSKNSVAAVTETDAIDYREFLRSCGLDFTYLLNAPFKFKDSEHEKRVGEYLDWVIKELQPDALTISSYELMKYIREKDQEIPIHISTIAGVKNSEDLKRYLDIKPNRVVPHHDCGKRWEDLKGIVELSRQHGIEVEMLATESCLFKCPQRDAHYQHLAEQTKDAPFHLNCNTKKLTNPREFLLAGGTIRPEDEDFYANMGVKYFKISGRSKPATWLPEVAKAYQEKKYDGNLIRLLGIDPSLKAEEWIYIDNKGLDGFIENFPQTGEECDEISYTDAWMVKLYNEGKFKVMDGTEYTVEGENLVLKDMGENVEQIVNREIGGFK